MPQVFVYVDGSDLQEVEALLLEKFQEFSQTWGVGSVKVVNDKLPRTSDLGPYDLPDWNLGINMEVNNLPRNKIEELLEFLSRLSTESGREFVIGEWRASTGISEDWCFAGKSIQQRNVEFLAGQLQ